MINLNIKPWINNSNDTINNQVQYLKLPLTIPSAKMAPSVVEAIKKGTWPRRYGPGKTIFINVPVTKAEANYYKKNNKKIAWNTLYNDRLLNVKGIGATMVGMIYIYSSPELNPFMNGSFAGTAGMYLRTCSVCINLPKPESNKGLSSIHFHINAPIVMKGKTPSPNPVGALMHLVTTGRWSNNKYCTGSVVDAGSNNPCCAGRRNKTKYTANTQSGGSCNLGVSAQSWAKPSRKGFNINEILGWQTSVPYMGRIGKQFSNKNLMGTINKLPKSILSQAQITPTNTMFKTFKGQNKMKNKNKTLGFTYCSSAIDTTSTKKTDQVNRLVTDKFIDARHFVKSADPQKSKLALPSLLYATHDKDLNKARRDTCNGDATGNPSPVPVTGTKSSGIKQLM